MSEVNKTHYILPNLFTAMNMGCGFFSVLMAINGKFHIACILVGIGAIFDLFDGKVARWTGTHSTFGEQFDSLSDLITFGITPSIIFYLRFLKDTGRVGMILSFLYLLCAALRLARFNTNINKVDSSYFQGLPSPGAALAIIGYILFSLEQNLIMNKYISGFYILIYSVLMITTVPFVSLKSTNLLAKHKKKIFLILLLILSSIFIYEEVIIFSLINLYVFFSLLYFLVNLKKLKSEIVDLENDNSI